MLPETMKAAVVHEFGKRLSIQNVSVPRPGLGQVLVRVMASGVCHTDLHAADGDWPVKPKLPFIPGHEGAGYVAAVGPGVTVLKEGDRVGVAWLHSACGHCDYCLTGWETLCQQQDNTGYSVDGAYAEYVLAPAAYVARIPDGLDFTEAAPILCAGVTTYKGLKQTDTKAGDWVAIVGIGGLGHMAVQYAKAMGLHVAAVDISEEKLELARSLGAELIVNAEKTDAATMIQKQVGGAHGVLVTAVSPRIFRQSLDMLRRGGTCTLVGLPPGEFPMPIFDIVLKGITVRGSIVGTRKDLQECLQFAAEGKVKAVIETQALEAVNEVFDRLKRGQVSGRVVLKL
ncbi:alcohol dehydrogenase, zinc-containing [Geotalea daltonii FRC-32]|uniref:alcohol dehydrogenase n=1 Tax=Geotalea daltonii (strain DSM 22248 / JCM 15807 / FRC-32) TaxID=316067 RepID=B9M087_GEODF|nr:alcohol dehydrogenase AdhP [Geotalea daltonii]ACM20867.1 alcohol dehydrogenase, zinc-containing [Geotalea daltonii FRC-32]